jgi:hypothetical protein
MALMVAFLILDELLRYKTWLHEQFNIIGKISVLVNVFLITFTYQLHLKSPVLAFTVYNSAVCIATIIILFTGIKNDIFKD